MTKQTKRTAAVPGLATLFFCTLILSACGGSSLSGSSSGGAVAPATADAAPASADPIAISASNYSVAQNAGSVSLTVLRTGTGGAAVSVDFSTSDATAVAGTDYTATAGTLEWAENDSTPKTISVPVSNATPFSGDRTFTVALTNPGAAAYIGSPGSATVTISGVATAAAGTLQLSDSSYDTNQKTATLAVTVTRTGGSSGAVSVAYATANGSATAGKDYTSTNGVLEWADGDAASKTFSVAISDASPFSGTRSFSVSLSDPRSGVALGTPGSATVTITGAGSASAGSLELSTASYTVAQTAGTLKVSVTRTNGSSGAVSVAYATANGTAVAGTDFTATKGTLNWAAGDSAAKTFSIAISTATPFSGSKAFKVVLSSPSAQATVSNPGTATVTVNGAGAPAVGSVELSASSYAVAQNVGSLRVTVNRAGGSSGAIAVKYVTTSKTAVAGTDFTTASGTVQWADGDAAAKTFTVAISNATPFSGSRSFGLALSTPTGGTSLGGPSSATATITGDAAAAMGSVQLSTSSYSVSQSGGSVAVTVNRTGGTSGAISVSYATANGTAVAGTDFSAANGTLQWADGDAASKSFSLAVSNATPFSGSKSLTVTLSNATAGASLSSPSSATVNISGSSSGAPAAPAGTFWVYHNGVFNWPGDYSWDATINYKDTAGGPLSGATDIAVTIVSRWGGFQPFAFPSGGTPFDTRPYKYLIYSVKPTIPNQVYSTGIDANNDVADGTPINIVGAPGGPPVTKYGPTPVVGVWGSYKIPIADFGLTNPLILKFSIADGTGVPTNLFYVDDVGFTTE